MDRPNSRNLGGGDWRLGYLKGHDQERAASVFDVQQVQRWVDARVPGNVRGDLMRAGALPDLFFGDECQRHDWVNDCFWWYEKRLTVERERGQRVFVDFRGVDYRSVVFWNQSRLGANEGMFTRLLYEVTNHLADSNMLRVRIAGSKYLPSPRLSWLDACWRPLASRLQGSRAYPDRFATLKCQMSYGWDFAPDLRTMGIWDDVFLHVSGPVFLERLALTAEVRDDGREAQLAVRMAVNSAAAGEYTVEISVAGDTCDAPEQTFRFPAYFRAARDVVERTVTVSQPQLWYTWDRGPQAMYRVTVRVWDGAVLVDELSERFGFRDFRLSRNADAPTLEPDWTFTLNGQRLFVRGANWVPADSLPGRVEDRDYDELLTLAREANINTLRVWGGGLREKETFYQRCAELGIMVWQEFPLACAFLDRFQRHEAYLAVVQQEVAAIVKAIHNAPAVVLYCGGNEFSPRRNEPVVEVIRRVVNTLDPQRPFFEASPRAGDTHNWFVWHNFANPYTYEHDTSQFVSEFGLQAPPHEESLRQFLPEAALWPPGKLWALHGAQLDKLERYAKPMGAYADLRGLIAASQRAQAQGLQIAIEHARRRKPKCSGVMFWQFNEPWPAISWSVVDFFRRPKLAYETVRRCYAPVLASVCYPRRRYWPGDTVPLAVWIINDTPERLTDCRLELYMHGDEGRAFSMAFTLDEIPPDSVEQPLAFDFVLPDRPDLTLHVDLGREGKQISANQYDLGVFDDLQAKPMNEFRNRITSRLLE